MVVPSSGPACTARHEEMREPIDAKGAATTWWSGRRASPRRRIRAWPTASRSSTRAADPTNYTPSTGSSFTSENCEPVTNDGLDSHWQCKILSAITKDKSITEEQYFSLHDFERKGSSDIVGTAPNQRARCRRSDDELLRPQCSIRETSRMGANFTELFN